MKRQASGACFALIFILLSNPAVAAGLLTLHFYPSPHGLQWVSPRALAWSALRNELSPSAHPLKHPIGHATIELSCGEGHVLTGMTEADDAEERDLLLSRERGLGILFHTFKGRLQDAAEIQNDLNSRYESGDVSWLDVKISDSNCERLFRYYSEYRERALDQKYGLPLRPRFGEGAGCTAFATSFLEVAGLLTQEYREAWAREIRVPEGLIGSEDGTRKVSILELLFSRLAGKWASPQDAGRSIPFWDPDRMNEWLKKTWARNQANSDGKYVLETRLNSLGLMIDQTDIAAPTEPIWQNLSGSRF